MNVRFKVATLLSLKVPGESDTYTNHSSPLPFLKTLDISTNEKRPSCPSTEATTNQRRTHILRQEHRVPISGQWLCTFPAIPASWPKPWLVSWLAASAVAGKLCTKAGEKLFVYTPRCHPPEAQVHLVFCMLPDPRRVGEAFAQGSRGWLIVSTPRLLHQTSHMKKLLFSLLDSLRMTVPTHGEGTNCAQDFWGQEVWRKPLQTPPTTWHSRRYNSGATEFLKPLGGRLWRTGNFHVRDKHNQQPANQPNYPFQTQGRRHHHHHHLHHHHLLHQHHVNINVNFNL